MPGYMLLLCNQTGKVHFLPSLLHHNFPTEGKGRKENAAKKKKFQQLLKSPTAFYPF